MIVCQSALGLGELCEPRDQNSFEKFRECTGFCAVGPQGDGVQVRAHGVRAGAGRAVGSRYGICSRGCGSGFRSAAPCPTALAACVRVCRAKSRARHSRGQQGGRRRVRAWAKTGGQRAACSCRALVWQRAPRRRARARVSDCCVLVCAAKSRAGCSRATAGAPSRRLGRAPIPVCARDFPLSTAAAGRGAARRRRWAGFATSCCNTKGHG